MEYRPNYLRYESKSEGKSLIVFSEIFTREGWSVKIDGQTATPLRANYILRAMNVPAGKHVVEFSFDPVSLHVTENIAFIALGILVLAAIAMAFIKIKACRKVE